jgi:hypothetical protein
MELNRNQYFLFGLVLLLVGIQLRMVDSYVLNEQATKFLAEKFGTRAQDAAAQTALPTLDLATGGAGSVPMRTVRPPIWLGWAFMSVGAVLVLHSLAMKRPD